MRFLTKGAYVQCALNGTNYCTSSLEAFKLIASNPIRMALTTGLSSVVNLLGKLAITFIVLIAAYYTMMSIEYFTIMVKNPVPPTVICGLIAFAISSLYMSVYGVSCNAIIQCFLMDEIDAKSRGQRARYCPEPLREIIDDNTYV
jgi:choline transporter-like protein 2/4/5